MKVKADQVSINRSRRTAVQSWRREKKTSLNSRAARIRCARDLGLSLSMVTDAVTELQAQSPVERSTT